MRVKYYNILHILYFYMYIHILKAENFAKEAREAVVAQLKTQQAVAEKWKRAFVSCRTTILVSKTEQRKNEPRKAAEKSR